MIIKTTKPDKYGWRIKLQYRVTDKIIIFIRQEKVKGKWKSIHSFCLDLDDREELHQFLTKEVLEYDRKREREGKSI